MNRKNKKSKKDNRRKSKFEDGGQEKKTYNRQEYKLQLKDVY